MGKPCGCAGSCGCDIRGRNGVRVTGSGIAPDTMWIELDGTSPEACDTIMTCVGGNLGDGLNYNAGTTTLSLKLSSTAGNQATIAPDGGLLVTGAGGGGGTSGQTVANLPAGANAIIGSTWGAGSSMWPEGIIESINAARALTGNQIRMVHLPVRVTSDGLPICLAEPFMGWYQQDGNPFAPRDFEHREHSELIINPGGSPPGAEGGYWGFYQPTSKGTPTLGDALAALSRRVVIVAEVRETVSPGEVADRIKAIVPQYEAQSCVIVAAEPVPSTGPNGPTIINAVSASITGSGLPIGIVLRTKQEVLDHPVATLTALGVTWVFMHQDLVDPFHPNYAVGAAEAYTAAGLNVMLTWVNRQYQAQRAAAIGIRGSLCTDPIYAYGAAAAWRYRRDAPSLGFLTPNTGQHSSWSDSVVGQQAHYRGYIVAGQTEQLIIEGDLHNPEQVEPYQSGYWILPGEVCPLRNANTYAMQCWWRWDGSLPADTSRWVGLWFDSPTDRSLRDFSGATAQTIGYHFTLTPNNEFSLIEYDGTPGAPPASRVLGTWAAPYSIAPNVYYGMRVEVTPTAIRLYSSTTSWPTPFNKQLIATINNPHRYIAGNNAGYVYFGRHYFFETGSRTNRLAGLTLQYTGF